MESVPRDFAGDLDDSKSTSNGKLCIFESRIFVPKSWMGKKQTSLRHGSTESEISSPDTGVRTHVIPTLDLLDVMMEVLNYSNVQPTQKISTPKKRTKKSRGKLQTQCP